MTDLATDPAWVEDMAATQSESVIACLDHCVALDMKPDALFLIDDVACTRGLLFSPDMWREIFKPMYERLARVLHDNDIWFWLHCCGNCEELVEDFVECELDVLQPLHVQAGMDIRTLKPLYGNDLTFFGNIDVPALSGPPEECEAEIRDKILFAKEGGGYMYHSDHSIPPEVSFKRYQWIMELVEKYGGYWEG